MMNDFKDIKVAVAGTVRRSEYSNPIDYDESLKYFDTDFSNYRRQGYKDYSPNGAIFIAKPDSYLEQKHFFGAKALSYIMSAEDSVDIDGALDLVVANAIMKKSLL